MKSVIAPLIIAIVSFAGLVLISEEPSDHDAEKASASWKQEASTYTSQEMAYMRRNGAFKK